jgi:hypothetical protein
MGLFDLPGFEDFIGGLDGKIVSGDCFGVYDADHKRKVMELIDKDPAYFDLIKRRCGISEADEDEYYGPAKNVRIINVDHFAIKADLADKLEEYRQKIYAVIDDVYAHQDEIDPEFELDEYGYDGCEEF